MGLDEAKLQELEPVFYPKSVAIIGASSKESKAGYIWVKAFVMAGYKGKIYPIGPDNGEILGWKIYPSLKTVPGPVDYVVVSIPRESVLQSLDDCADKGVRVVTFFTAGFRETGDNAWQEIEAEMLKKARQGGLRIIGPNCLGAYCPEIKMPLIEGMVGEPGGIGFVSQSGGIAAKLVSLGIARGINYSKGVSFGNGIDLDSIDFLEYLAADLKTKVIGAYIEGVRDGRRFLDTIKEVAKAKPLIVWKGGRTKAGADATASHTGSLSSSSVTWSAALKQAGVVEVYGLEELTDTLLLFQEISRWQGSNVAIITGICGAGGGAAVSAADTCTGLGLNIPPLSQQTRDNLMDLLGPIGSILHNPLDITPTLGSSSILEKVMEIVVADPAIELILVQEDVDILLCYVTKEELKKINNVFINFRKRQVKPIVLTLPPGVAETERLEIARLLSRGGIAVFPSVERAAKAIMNMRKYFHFHTGQKDCH